MKLSKIVIPVALVAAVALGMALSKRSGAQASATSPDGVATDPNNYKVLYEDAHIRLVEVTVRPGESEKMHIDPYPLVIVRDAALPSMLTGDTSNAPGDGHAGGPKDLPFPVCSTVAAQPAHAISNHDTFPLHYYRIEYKRIDAGEDFRAHWKTWYSWILDPLKPVKNVSPPADAPPFSKEFPFPIAYDSYIAAPNNHFMRYQDDHIRFLEVVFRPGERENLHGHPYYSVFTQDSDRGPSIPVDHADGLLAEPGFHLNPDGTPQRTSDYAILLDPSSPFNDMGDKIAPPPVGAQWPRCVTAAPQAPHTSYNGHEYPIHFYRLEFRRLDGYGIKTHWKEWYPWMAGN
jgi:hypothetical protein